MIDIIPLDAKNQYNNDSSMSLSFCQKGNTKIKIRQTAGFLKTIAEENRLKILCLLRKREMCVCEIWQDLDLPQNLVSHHLKILKKAGLIASRKEGTKVLYSLEKQVMEDLKSLLNNFI